MQDTSRATWLFCFENAKNTIQYLEDAHKEMFERVAHTEHWAFICDQDQRRISEWKIKAKTYEDLLQ